MSCQVSDATKNDVGGLIEVYSSPELYHNREEASWFVKSYFDYHHIKVVKRRREVVGAIFWNTVEEKHHGLTNIQDLYIDEKFRRKGLGERLLRASIEDMKKLYAKHRYTLRKVFVTTGEDNKPARNLYEKIGFRLVAALPDLFAKGENELAYILTLNP
ncbi:MAG TPA: N-acetyltransferase [Candidatus Bathyarchaeia archaeon]|nr:N-acetyltransferase [Candidatus Bathyarchaeia archaeon]